MHRTLFKSTLGYVASRNANFDRPIILKPSKVADFCMNKCPHTDKPCEGSCEEFKTFKKNLKGEN